MSLSGSKSRKNTERLRILSLCYCDPLTPKAPGSLPGSEMLQQITQHASLLVFEPVRVAGHVPLLRKHQQIVVLLSSRQCRDEPRRVPEVHVLIGHPVDEEQLPSQLLHVIEH